MRDVVRATGALRTRVRALTSLLALAALAGCGARPPARRTDGRRPATLPIFVTAESDIPRVRARVGGMDVDLMVDSGVAVHVVEDGLALHLSLPRDEVPIAFEDLSGASTAAGRPVEPILAIAGREVPARATVLASAPILGRVGVAGLLSPPALARFGHPTVVDLRRGVLRVDDEELGEGRDLAPEGGEPCEEEGTLGAVFVVRGLIEGVPARMIVDTGMPRSVLSRRSPAARALAARISRARAMDAVDAALGDHEAEPRRVGLVGVAEHDVLPDVALTVGELELRVDLDVGGERDVGCGADAILGRDVLNRCAIAFGRTELRGLCDDEPPPPLRTADPGELPRMVLAPFVVAGACEETRVDELDLGSVVGAQARLRAVLEAVASTAEAECRRTGHADARARWRVARSEGGRVLAEVRVIRGLAYTFGRVDVEALRRGGLREPPPLRARTGEPFSWDLVREDTASLREALAGAGLAANVVVHVEPASSSGEMDVTFLPTDGE